jgi:hypothetical protein
VLSTVHAQEVKCLQHSLCVGPSYVLSENRTAQGQVGHLIAYACQWGIKTLWRMYTRGVYGSYLILSFYMRQTRADANVALCCRLPVCLTLDCARDVDITLQLVSCMAASRPLGSSGHDPACLHV